MTNVDAGVLLDGRYRIVQRRAAGATAVVWEAEDEFLRRRVAVKILYPHLASDTDLLDRFIAEARTAATVNHPALVAVYDSILDQPGIVLEWIEGPDLRERLDRGVMPAAEVAEVGATLCDGLAALHAHGLVHRDVKPANILLTTAGQPKLTDFGIATANAGDRTATGVVLGTAKYLAPEQVRGDRLDGRTDVFALAAVLYEALCGHPPWVREGDLPTALARLEVEAPDLRSTHPQLPLPVTQAVMHGLARERDARWPSADAFGAALRGESTLPPPPTRPMAPATMAPVPAARPGPRDMPPRSPVETRSTPKIRPRRRVWPRVLGFAVLAAIAVLGWTLVSAIADTTGSGGGPGGSVGDPVAIDRVEAFDPEGSGPPGEHNEQTANAIDGDLATTWSTESYRARDLGLKSGVGLILTLERIVDVTSVTIDTLGAQDWAVEIRVASTTGATATEIADFGPTRGAGSGLGPSAEIAVSGRGDTVVIWLTDLGNGLLPVHLSIAEVTVR